MVQPAEIKEILEPSDIVGNIRFSHPTLYVFPGGQGDSALFGVNGFNMLIDGGFSRRSCFWDFTRHLDRLDAVLLTRVNNNAVSGLESLMDRKRMNQVYPQIGHFFGNVMERKHPKSSSEEAEPSKGELLVSLTESGQRLLDNLKSINIRPQHCFRDHGIDPINLYHKVGHGKLDMYVLNPSKDSREVKEFLSKWNTDCKSFVQARMSVKVEGKETNYPVLNLVSICALLVWQPDNQREPITRILFPGSTPQQKIFEALGKLKHLEFLKYPICSAKTLAASHKSKIKSERIVSEARAQLKTGDTPSESAKASRAPSESRVTSSSRYSSSLYAGVKSKITTTASSQKSDSSSTIQTAEEKEKEKKGRERSREKKKEISSTKESSLTTSKDNKIIEEVKKSSSTTTTKSRIDSGLNQSNNNNKTRSRSKSKVTAKSKIDSGNKKASETETSGTATPTTKESTISSNIRKSTSSTSKYGIGSTTTAARTVVSKSSAAVSSSSSTPPKAAKDATNRKVVESKTNLASNRKSLLEKSKESKEKSATTTTTMSKPPPAPKAKSSLPQRPSTASATKKPTASEKNGNAAVPVRRPVNKTTAAIASAAAVGVAATAATIVAASNLTESSKGEEEEKVDSRSDSLERKKEKLDVEDTMDKDSIEEDVQIVIKPHTNGLGPSVPATESSSELSSLEHVIDFENDKQDEGLETPLTQSRPGTELSEEVSTSEDAQSNKETEKVETVVIGKGPESETHTITEPGDGVYDEEEDEYLIVEKDEISEGKELADGSNNKFSSGGGESYYEEKEVIEEKEIKEELDKNVSSSPTMVKSSEDSKLEEESAIPEPEKSRKSSVEHGYDLYEAPTSLHEILKMGSATELEMKLPEEVQEYHHVDELQEELQKLSERKKSADFEPITQKEFQEEESQEGLQSPPSSPKEIIKQQNTDEIETKSDEPDFKQEKSEEQQQLIFGRESDLPSSTYEEKQREFTHEINKAMSIEEISEDLNKLEKDMDESTLSKFEHESKIHETLATTTNLTLLKSEEDVAEGGISPTKSNDDQLEFGNKQAEDNIEVDVLKYEEGDEISGEKSKLDLKQSFETGSTLSSGAENEFVVHGLSESVPKSLEVGAAAAADDNSQEKVETSSFSPVNVVSKDEVDHYHLHEKEELETEDKLSVKSEHSDRKSSISVEEIEQVVINKTDLSQSVESIKSKEGEDDKHSVKSGYSESEDRRHSIEEKLVGTHLSKSVESIKSKDGDEDDSNIHSNIPVEEKLIKEAVSHSVDDNDDDKHSVKSGHSGMHDDKLSVASISPARSVEDVIKTTTTTALETTVSGKEIEELKSLSPDVHLEHQDKRSSIGSIHSVEDVKQQEFDFHHKQEDDNLHHLQASDKESVKSGDLDIHDDKHSVASLSPARSAEHLKDEEDGDKLLIKSDTDKRSSIGSLSSAKSIEELKPLTEAQGESKEDNALPSSSPKLSQEFAQPERKKSFDQQNASPTTKVEQFDFVTKTTEAAQVMMSDDSVPVSTETGSLPSTTTKEEDKQLITESPEPEPESLKFSEKFDLHYNTKPSEQTEPEHSITEEGRPSSAEIDFDTEILPSEAAALAMAGEMLIKKEEQPPQLTSATHTDEGRLSPNKKDEKEEIKETVAVVDSSFHHVEKLDQRNDEIDTKSQEQKVQEIHSDTINVVASEKETTFEENKNAQSEPKTEFIEEEKEDVPTTTDKKVIEDDNDDEISPATKAQGDFHSQSIPATASEKDLTQKSELSLTTETDDPASVFSPGDSIRTEELDLALEEHRRRLSAANSQGGGLDIMGNILEDKVEIETSRESQFGSVNEEDVEDEEEFEPQKNDDDQKLHFKNKEECAGEEAQTPMAQQIQGDDNIPINFGSSIEPKDKENIANNKEQEQQLAQEKDEMSSNVNNSKRQIPSAIPSKFPREQKEVVRTPDEVADLPMHEEVDPGSYKEQRKSDDDGDEESNEEVNKYQDKTTEDLDFSKEHLTSQSVNTFQTAATTFTTHTTKDEESPGLQIDTASIEKCADLHVEKDGGDEEEQFIEIVEDLKKESAKVDKQLPKDEEKQEHIAIVEKIDAAVSPVLESLLNKSLEQEQPGEITGLESDKYSNGNSVGGATTAIQQQEDDIKIASEDKEQTRAFSDQGEKDSLSNKEKVEDESERKSPSSLVMRTSVATTSVVITPSTPPVVVVGNDGILGNQSDSTTSNDNNFSYENEPENKFQPSIEERKQSKEEESSFVSSSITSTTTTSAAISKESDESSTSSALTAVSKEKEEKVETTDNVFKDEVGQVQGEGEHKKIFFIPKDDDDEDDDEDESDSQNSPHHHQGAESDFYDDQQLEIGGGIIGAVESGLLNAANTVSAILMRESPEKFANIPAKEDNKQDLDKPSAESIDKPSDLESQPIIDKQQPLDLGHEGDLATPIKKEEKIDEPLSPTQTHLTHKDYHPENYQDLKHLVESEDHQIEESYSFQNEDQDVVLASTQKKENYGYDTTTPGPGESGEIDTLDTVGNVDKIKSPTAMEKEVKIEKSNIEIEESKQFQSQQEEPISYTSPSSSLLESAQSAVTDVVETASETLQVAHSTLEEVEKNAENLLNSPKQKEAVEEEVVTAHKIEKQRETCPSTHFESEIQDKICDAMKGSGNICIKRVGDDVDEDDGLKYGRTEMVEEVICVKSVAPKPIIPEKFYEQVDDEDEDERDAKPEEEVHLVLKKEVIKSPLEDKSESVNKVIHLKTTTTTEDSDALADLEEQILAHSEMISQTVDKKDEKEEMKDKVKSPVMDFDESSAPQDIPSLSSSSMQLIEEEQKVAEPIKKKKELSDYIGTIKEAKAVFDTLLKIAKSGAELSSAVDECRENAQEAIRRHLEAAEDYYYKPASNKDPDYVDVPDSPEPEVGVTVYENLEQMAKAGVELFSGLVEKVEKEIEEKARREAEGVDKPGTPEATETDNAPRGTEERRSSAELAVTAALQHLHETFKAMQTMGASPKRSSSAAASRMTRCHHHDSEHHHHHQHVCEHHQHHGHSQQMEDEEKSVASATSSSSAIFSGAVGEDSVSTLKSPLDEDATEKSEGETMRESFTESGVISQSEGVEDLLNASSALPGQGQEVVSDTTTQKSSDEEESIKSKSEENTVKTPSSFVGTGSDFEQKAEKSENVERESKIEETKTDSGYSKIETELVSKSSMEKTSETSKNVDEKSGKQTQSKAEEFVTSDKFESSTSSASIQKEGESIKLHQEELLKQEQQQQKEIFLSETQKNSTESNNSKLEQITSSTTFSTTSNILKDEQQQIMGQEFLSRYEDSAAQMYKEEFGDGSFRRFSSVDSSSPLHVTEQKIEESSRSKLSRGISEASSTQYYGEHFEFSKDKPTGASSDFGYQSATVEPKDYSTTTTAETKTFSDPVTGQDATTTTTTIQKVFESQSGDDTNIKSKVLESESKTFSSSIQQQQSGPFTFSTGSSSSGFEQGTKFESSSFEDSSGPFSFIGTTTNLPETEKKETIVTKTIKTSDVGEGIQKSENITVDETLFSNIPSSSAAFSYPQEEEPYSSGDFTDSQPSSIPTQHAETDEEVHNYDLPAFSSTTTTIVTQGDVDNGNFSSTTTTTTKNANLLQKTDDGMAESHTTTTSSFTTSSQQQFGNNGNLNKPVGVVSGESVGTSSTTNTTTTTTTSSSDGSEILKEWGKPLGLPVVYPTEGENASSAGATGTSTPKKTATKDTPSKSSSGSKRTSARKASRHSPIYVDLAYVPHQGNKLYCDSEFFRMIRARYYVFSGLEPSREVFEGLLQGKQQWEDKNLETTIIPTYDTDTLGYFVQDSEKELAEAKIDLAPSASRCTINLQDHETSCAAYRLEF